MTSTLWVPCLLTWEVLLWMYVHTCPWNPLLSCLLGALICSSLNPHRPYCEPNPELLSSVFHLTPPATATPLSPSHLLCSDSGPSPLTKLVSLLSSKPQMDSGLYSFAPLQTDEDASPSHSSVFSFLHFHKIIVRTKVTKNNSTHFKVQLQLPCSREPSVSAHLALTSSVFTGRTHKPLPDSSLPFP